MMRSFRTLAAACCAAALATAWLVVGSSEARVKRTLCGHVQRTVAVSAHHIACKPARKVALTYLRGLNDPYGFSCHRYKVNAAAGWWVRCTRGSRLVQITPE